MICDPRCTLRRQSPHRAPWACCTCHIVRSCISNAIYLERMQVALRVCYSLFLGQTYRFVITLCFCFWCKSNTKIYKLQIGNFDIFISKNYNSLLCHLVLNVTMIYIMATTHNRAVAICLMRIMIYINNSIRSYLLLLDFAVASLYAILWVTQIEFATHKAIVLLQRGCIHIFCTWDV